MADQNLGTARLVHAQDIEAVLPVSLASLRVSNAVSRRVLANPQDYAPFDKIGLDFRGSRFRAMAPTKVRAMIGAGDRYVGVKVLAANEMLPGPRAHSILFLLDRKGRVAYMAFDAERVTDLRTASSAAVGVEALTHGPYVAALLGMGPVGMATAFALAALDSRPAEIRLTAKTPGEYGSVTERLQAGIAAHMGEIAALGIRLTPCEDIAQACQGAGVIVDCTSAPKHRALIGATQIGARGELLLVDVGKYAVDPGAVAAFDSLVFDSLKLMSLSSPASDHCRKQGLPGQELGEVMRSPSAARGKVLYTVLGLPVIDTLLAELVLSKL